VGTTDKNICELVPKVRGSLQKTSIFNDKITKPPTYKRKVARKDALPHFCLLILTLRLTPLRVRQTLLLLPLHQIRKMFHGSLQVHHSLVFYFGKVGAQIYLIRQTRRFEAGGSLIKMGIGRGFHEPVPYEVMLHCWVCWKSGTKFSKFTLSVTFSPMISQYL
jgi:hypothetical protein